jgi:transposase
MNNYLIDDKLWAIIEPLLPPPPPRPYAHPGRKRLDNRKSLSAVAYVLSTGIGWEDLPQEKGWGCGMSAWRRHHEWQAAGVWDQVWHLLLDRLRQAGRLDFSRAVVDSASVRAVGGGEKNRPQPHRSQPSGQQAPRAG